MRKRIVVLTGGSSGLGLAIGRALNEEISCLIYDLSREPGPDPSFRHRQVDVTDHRDLRGFVDSLPPGVLVDTVINCAGVNYLAPIQDLDDDGWDMVMDTNVKGIFNTAKVFLPHLRETRGTILNVVSNASHVPMTHSAAYNASKGAAHILTLQMARELTKAYGISVFGISPAKLEGTGMSRYIEEVVPKLRGWTPEQAEEYQRAALLTGREIPPDRVAEFAAYLLSSKERHEFLSGCVLPYGA